MNLRLRVFSVKKNRTRAVFKKEIFSLKKLVLL